MMDLAVRAVQARLADMGFDPGPVDGRMGKQTAAAMMAALDLLATDTPPPAISRPPAAAAVTPAMLQAITGRKPGDNATSVLDALGRFGVDVGLDAPHRLAHYLSQLAHESMGFIYDREVWGPTPAQKKYEGRADLGNVKPGDGYLYRGRGPVQITGRANYRQFRDWCRATLDPDAPDFEAHPDLVCVDPWEGLAPIWYWSTRNLAALADRAGDQVEAITRRINGGTNGLDDRQRLYARAALVLLGYHPNDVRGFQRATPGLDVDGDAGAKTRAALAAALRRTSTPLA